MRSALAYAVVCVVGGVVGCGGGQVSAADYIERVNEICAANSADYQAALKEIAADKTRQLRREQPTAPEPSIAGAVSEGLRADALNLGVQFNDTERPRMLDEIDALKGPAEETARVDAYLEEARARLASYRHDVFLRLTENRNPFERLQRLADEAELGDCS